MLFRNKDHLTLVAGVGFETKALVSCDYPLALYRFLTRANRSAFCIRANLLLAEKTSAMSHLVTYEQPAPEIPRERC